MVQRKLLVYFNLIFLCLHSSDGDNKTSRLKEEPCL